MVHLAWAQEMQRWQQKQEEVQQQSQDELQDQQQQAPAAAAAGPASKQQLVATIVLESAEQEPVAMALLAAMYKGPKGCQSSEISGADRRTAAASGAAGRHARNAALGV